MKFFFKALFFFVLFFLIIFPSRSRIKANENKIQNSNFKVKIFVFVRESCLHCGDEEKYFNLLVTKRNDLDISYLHLENENSRKLWDEFTQRLKISKVTPITVIGVNYIIGFDKGETTGKEIISLIDKTKSAKIITNLEKISPESIWGVSSTCDEEGLIPCTVEDKTFYISIPFLGKINTAKYPLLILSALLGFFDGFNPCAMWVLITFLIILIQVGNRKKMLIFAGTFILAEAIMYTMILTVWYKTWDFVRLDNIITPVVGVVSIVGGLFFLNEYRKKEIECRVTNISQRHKTRKKIEELVVNPFTIFTFLGILGIAFSVNIIEFACSIGIPQTFTKILDINRLPFWQTGIFMTVYILFYIIDDLFVFALALYGAEKLHLTAKYSKISNLIGGFVMIILGLILVLKPNLLLY